MSGSSVDGSNYVRKEVNSKHQSPHGKRIFSEDINMNRYIINDVNHKVLKMWAICDF